MRFLPVLFYHVSSLTIPRLAFKRMDADFIDHPQAMVSSPVFLPGHRVSMDDTPFWFQRALDTPSSPGDVEVAGANIHFET